MYIVQVYEDNRDYYHAVAVIKRGSLTFEDGKPVRTLSDLRGKHACFAGVGTQVSCDWWTVRSASKSSIRRFVIKCLIAARPL